MLFYLHVEKSINIAASFAIAIFQKLEIIRQYDRAAINWTINFNVTRSSNYAMKHLYDSGGAFKTQSDPMCYLMIGRDQNFIKNLKILPGRWQRCCLLKCLTSEKSNDGIVRGVTRIHWMCQLKKKWKKSFWIKRVMVQKMMDGLVKSQNYWIL